MESTPWIYERVRADTAGRSMAAVHRTLPDGSRQVALEVSVSDRADPKAFHPFRQWDGQDWRQMAIIAHELHSWCVADLDAGRIVATRRDPLLDGEPAPGMSFYPHRFRIFGPEDNPSADGTWGVMAGCLWGDDDYYKLRHVELSGAQNGSVYEDERYGYLELPNGVGLDHVALAGPDTVVVPTAIAVHKTTGRVHPSTGSRWNWAGSHTTPTSTH